MFLVFSLYLFGVHDTPWIGCIVWFVVSFRIGQQVSDLAPVKIKLTARSDTMLLVVCFKLVLGLIVLAASDCDFPDDLRSALTRSDDLDPVPDQSVQVGLASCFYGLETIHNPIREVEACLIAYV